MRCSQGTTRAMAWNSSVSGTESCGRVERHIMQSIGAEIGFESRMVESINSGGGEA